MLYNYIVCTKLKGAEDMSINFYNMIFVEDNFLPFYRQGISIELVDTYISINGLGRHRIFRKPEIIEDNSNFDEVFKEYSSKEPWVGEKKGKFYLYRGQINEDYLDFEKNEDKFTYLQITTKEEDTITVLNGKIFFRNFVNGEQIALVKFAANTMLTIEKNEGIIMIEFVDGKFVCR